MNDKQRMRQRVEPSRIGFVTPQPKQASRTSIYEAVDLLGMLWAQGLKRLEVKAAVVYPRTARSPKAWSWSFLPFKEVVLRYMRVGSRA